MLRGVVDRAGERHTLTDIERRLVRRLAERPGEPISRELLLLTARGVGYRGAPPAPLTAVEAQGGLAQLRALVNGSLVVWAETRREALRYRLLRPVADSVRALSADGLHTAERSHAAWVSTEARRRAGPPGHDVEDPTSWHANEAEVLLAVGRAEPLPRWRKQAGA